MNDRTLEVGYYRSPFGLLKIVCSEGSVVELSKCSEDTSVCTEVKPAVGLAGDVCKELDEYFAGRRKTFSAVCNPYGTEFQKKVWHALTKIPYGQTCSYKELAVSVGSPKACRAVGMANHANPIIIIIPCHRVIGADGSLTGYGGGLDMKKGLLDLETRNTD